MKQTRRQKILYLLPLLAILLISGCQPRQPVINEPLSQHLNYSISSLPAVLDPARITDKGGLQLANAVFEGVVRLKPDNTLEKAMAENWEIDNNGTRYTFKLRDSSWADGEKVTAYDFEYAWKRALSPDNTGRYVYLLYTIKNAEGYHRSQDNEYRGKKYTREEVGVKAIDESTLVVELSKSDPLFLKKLIHPVFSPLPQQVVEAQPDAFFQAHNLQGNGPFKIMQAEMGTKYELIKNEKYWDRDSVKLASMTWFIAGDDVNGAWEMYKNNRLDLTLAIPQDELEKGLEKGTIVSVPLAVQYVYHFNTTKVPFNDLKVRQALSCALDRQGLIDKVLQGAQIPAAGFVPQAVYRAETGVFGREISDLPEGNESRIPDNNLKEAHRLLLEAGYPAGAGFPTIELLISEQPEQYYLAQAIKEEWHNKLGIETVITQEGWQQRVGRTESRDYDLALVGSAVDIADAAAFLERYTSRSSYNDMGWVSLVYDQHLKNALTDDESLRQDALQSARKILNDELPALPIYEYTRIYCATSRLKGVYFPPTGPEAEFKWAYHQ